MIQPAAVYLVNASRTRLLTALSRMSAVLYEGSDFFQRYVYQYNARDHTPDSIAASLCKACCM
jgi:hypothetical protein